MLAGQLLGSFNIEERNILKEMVCYIKLIIISNFYEIY